MSESQRVENRQHRRSGGLTGAVLLIGIGLLLLLNTLGIISFNWLFLLRYWPVLLILAGLDLLLGRQSLAGGLFVTILSLAIIVGLALYAPAGKTAGGDFSHQVGDVSTLNIELAMGAVNADISAGEPGTVYGSYTTGANQEIVTGYHGTGSTGTFTVEQNSRSEEPVALGSGYPNTLDLNLPDDLPLNLTVAVGAGDLTIDLSGLDVRSLEVKGGAGDVTITLPTGGRIDVDMSVAAGSIRINVPDSMQAQVIFDTAATSRSLSGRFEKSNETWRTDGYSSTAEDRALIHISMAAGAVRID